MVQAVLFLPLPAFLLATPSCTIPVAWLRHLHVIIGRDREASGANERGGGTSPLRWGMGFGPFFAFSSFFRDLLFPTPFFFHVWRLVVVCRDRRRSPMRAAGRGETRASFVFPW